MILQYVLIMRFIFVIYVIVFPLAAFMLFRDLSHKNA